MRIDTTHVPLEQLARELGVPDQTLYDHLRAGGAMPVREDGRWWACRQVAAQLHHARRQQFTRDLEVMRADLIAQGYAGDRLEAELAHLSAVLSGARPAGTISTARVGGAR